MQAARGSHFSARFNKAGKLEKMSMDKLSTIHDEDEEGDEEDDVVLNLFAITSNDPIVKEDIEVGSEASEKARPSKPSPYLVVDVTDAVRDKVEEAVALYNRSSTEIKAIKEGPLSQLGTPAFVIGSQKSNVGSSYVPAHCLADSTDHVRAPITIKLAMSPVVMGGGITASSPRFIRNSVGQPMSITSQLSNNSTAARPSLRPGETTSGSMLDLRRRMIHLSNTNTTLSPRSGPKVVRPSQHPGPDNLVVTQSYSTKTLRSPDTSPNPQVRQLFISLNVIHLKYTLLGVIESFYFRM